MYRKMNKLKRVFLKKGKKEGYVPDMEDIGEIIPHFEVKIDGVQENSV